MNLVTDAGSRSRPPIRDEQYAAALDEAREKRKWERKRLAFLRERRARIRGDLERAGVVFLDDDAAYNRARPGRVGKRKGERKKWDRDYRAALARARIASLMQSAPGASTSHRGTKSTYNTADRGAVRREPDAPRERLTDGRRHPVTVARVSDSRGRMRP